MKYVVSYSGGLGSFMAAKLTIDKYGSENCHLLFTDTKTEDEDLLLCYGPHVNHGIELETAEDGTHG